jgi:hypothetical protein
MRYYEAPDGKKYRMIEAKYDMAFKVYRSDRRKAKVLDPHDCLLALGILRNRDVIDVFVGAGRDAYVVFRGENGGEPYAVHFVLNRPTKRVIDNFDKDRLAKTQQIILRRPSDGRTLDARNRQDKARKARIKAGTHHVKHRPTPRASRIARLGVGQRPKPRVSKSGNVSATVEAVPAS